MSREAGERPAFGAKIRLLVALGTYAAVLHFAYEVRIAPVFGYLGSRYREPSLLNYVFVLILVGVLGLMMPKKLQKPSDFIVWLLFIMTAIPSMLVPQYADIISQDESLRLAGVVAASFGLVTVLAAKGPSNLLPRIRVPSQLVWLLVAVISVGVYGYMYITTGLSLSIGDIIDVRATRFEYRDVITQNGTLLGYLVRLQGNVINPALLARGLFTRRWHLVAAATVGQILIFTATGYKLTLLSVPALIAVAYLFRNNEPRGSKIVFGIIATSVAALAIDTARNTLTFTELLIDRLLLIPGTLTAAHVMVFQGEEKALWAYSFLSPFIHYPYQTTPAFMVGEQFNGSAVTSANANYFADGYANLGYAGIFIEGAVLIILLWVLNSAASGLPNAVAALVVFVPTLSLVNSSVFTSLLTGGFVAAALILAVLPREGWRRETKIKAPP